MANTSEHFVSHELNSEIAVSSGVAATAMEDGYSGIVNISPFACLIGRVIEGLFAPWARERGYPMISVEVDGNLLPPSLVSKLDIFMVNVLRFRGRGDSGRLVEAARPAEPARPAERAPAEAKAEGAAARASVEASAARVSLETSAARAAAAQAQPAKAREAE